MGWQDVAVAGIVGAALLYLFVRLGGVPRLRRSGVPQRPDVAVGALVRRPRARDAR